MSSHYDPFINKYRVKNVHVSRDRNYQRIDYNYNYNQAASYYADREELIEMELSRSGFEDLVRLDSEHERVWQDQRYEAHLRKMHPALEEAYSKYRMLLEIYK